MNIKEIGEKIKRYKHNEILFFVLWFICFLILAFFRGSRLDENIYIGDSVEIANILQRGEWIGNYGVGMHGFINKLIVGVIFIFTGPSVFIATLSNIFFAFGSGIVFYKILIKHFKFNKIYSLLGVTLLFCSYQFLTYTPSFYRDIPSLFFVILVLDSILNKNSKWITGLFLMLLLDSKEHVFYTIAPAFVIWIALECYFNFKGDIIKIIKSFIINNLKIFLPSFVLLLLMFTTSIVPLNIYNGNILGLIDGGLKSMAANFDLETATYNRDIAVNEELAKVMPTIPIPEGASIFVSFIVYFVNIILSYIGKILYPRTFSMLSIPFIMLIPSLWFGYRYFIDCIRKQDKSKLFIPLVLFVYLAIYVLHASISRYILPISPVIFLFFLLFLRNLSPKHIYTKKVFILTIIFVMAGLYFEYSYVLVKIFINGVLFSLLLLIYFCKNINKHFLNIIFILLLSLFCGGTSLLASYSYGQIREYRLYGYNRECEKIVSLVDKDETIWINNIYWDRLPLLLREENLGNPEWRWNLMEWIPKKKWLIKDEKLNTHYFFWKEEEQFKSEINSNGVQKVVYIKLHVFIEKEKSVLQDKLEEMVKYNWLKLESETKMKNKTVYIFQVLN